MTDRELLDRIRACGIELDQLVQGAGDNTKYYTRMVLQQARHAVAEAESALVWHVEG